MTIARSAATAVALTLAAGSAQAAVGTPPPATKPPVAVETTVRTAETRYCIIDTVTGSRIPRKVCQTRKDWLARGFDPLAPNRE